MDRETGQRQKDGNDCMTRRERILSKQDLKEELLHIPEWDDEEGKCELLILSLTGRQRAHWLQQATNKDGIDLTKVYPDLLIACCHDPETRQPVFEAPDRDALNEKCGAALERIAQVAIRLSGLTAAAIEAAEKN